MKTRCATQLFKDRGVAGLIFQPRSLQHQHVRALDGFRNGRRFPYQPLRSEEHTSELQSLMRISYAVFCLKKKNKIKNQYTTLSTKHTQNEPTKLIILMKKSYH